MKVLNIYDPIGKFDEGYFGIKKIDAFLKEVKDENEFLIRLSTPGGEVLEAVGIYDKLKACGKDITILCEGVVASAGTIILLAGNTRQSLENTQFLIHNARVSFDMLEDATSKDYEKRAKDLKDADNLIKKIYNDVIPQKIDKVYELMEREELVDVDKMLELGFITEKVTIVENIKNVFNFNNKKNNEKMSKNLLEGVSEGIEKILAKLQILGAKNEAPEIKNKKFTLKDGGEIEAESITEGASTTAEDGEYELETGEKITVEAGVIIRVEELKKEDDKDKELESLTTENKTLKRELEALKSEAEKKQIETQGIMNEILLVKQAVAKYNLPADKDVNKKFQYMSDEEKAWTKWKEGRKLKNVKK